MQKLPQIKKPEIPVDITNDLNIRGAGKRAQRESAIKSYTQDYLKKREDMMKSSLQKKPLGKLMFRKKQLKKYYKPKPKPKVINRG